MRNDIIAGTKKIDCGDNALIYGAFVIEIKNKLKNCMKNILNNKGVILSLRLI